jgi:hypothetical protein
MMDLVDNLPVGKPDIRPWAPAHTTGVREGNIAGQQAGIRRVSDFMSLATPRRSTGVNARGRTPIDPRMPILTPA